MSPLLVGATVQATPAVLGAAARQGPALAQQQRAHAAVDASIEPVAFVRPDLTTHAAKVAARRAGIDLDRWLARHP